MDKWKELKNLESESDAPQNEGVDKKSKEMKELKKLAENRIIKKLSMDNRYIW